MCGVVSVMGTILEAGEAGARSGAELGCLGWPWIVEGVVWCGAVRARGGGTGEDGEVAEVFVHNMQHDRLRMDKPSACARLP